MRNQNEHLWIFYSCIILFSVITSLTSSDELSLKYDICARKLSFSTIGMEYVELTINEVRNQIEDMENSIKHIHNVDIQKIKRNAYFRLLQKLHCVESEETFQNWRRCVWETPKNISKDGIQCVGLIGIPIQTAFRAVIERVEYCKFNSTLTNKDICVHVLAEAFVKDYILKDTSNEVAADERLITFDKCLTDGLCHFCADKFSLQESSHHIFNTDPVVCGIIGSAYVVQLTRPKLLKNEPLEKVNQWSKCMMTGLDQLEWIKVDKNIADNS